MPTLEELFKSKKLANGKTAEQYYGVRNSKDIEQSSANGLMGLPFKASNAIKRKLGSVGTETFLEEETTGVRILSTLASPIIYGTQIGRITLQSTDAVDTMKSSANGSSTSGLLGGLINSVKSTINTLSSKLGIPQTIYPTTLKLNVTDFNNSKIDAQDTMVQLAKIKKDAKGTLFGKFLKQTANTTPTQLSDNLAGAATSLAKNGLKNLLLGSRKQAANEAAKNVSFRIIRSSNTKIDFDKRFLFMNFIFQNSEREPYTSKIDPSYPDAFGRFDLSQKYESIRKDIRFPEKALLPLRYTQQLFRDNKSKQRIERSRGMTNNKTSQYGYPAPTGSYGDVLNTMTAYESKNGDNLKLQDDKFLDDYDFVVLKFFSVANSSAVNFRATITGLTETFSPNWDSNRFMGNPFNFYTYNSIERSVQFNFKVYSLSEAEHIAAWQRLSFLSSLVYPQNYAGNNYVIPPFIKLSLGDMYKNKECFIESLIYTIDDNNTWEIGLNKNTKDYKLPNIIDVGITLKFVESKGTTFGQRPYGYGGVDKSVQTQIEKDKNILPSGVPIVKKKTADLGIAKPVLAQPKKLETKPTPFVNGAGPIKGNSFDSWKTNSLGVKIF